MEHRFQAIQRRGSLPLKKRRLSLDQTAQQPLLPPISSFAADPNGTKLVTLTERPLTLPQNRDGKIAALALVAAAASSETFASMIPCLPGMETGFYSHQQAANTLSHLILYPQQAEMDTSSEEEESDDSDDEVSDEGSTMHATSLTSPSPRRCHGRTSKNSLCQRSPCYKGSNYCKLHYQQKVDESKRVAQDAVGSAGTNLHRSTSQDKRYTGAADEVCCKATTTRGRACAYVAVDGTNYCHLHSDYETNPPPRRGVTRKADRDAGHTKVPTEVSIASAPSVSSDDLSRTSQSLVAGDKPKPKAVRRTNARLAEMHAEAPYPLLSMISTDQWFGKTVTISTGPMIDKVGTVEKWGNGWVTVNVPGVGDHNRRSFELYLHTENDKGELVLQRRNNDDHHSTVRCVSRDDMISPLPSEAKNAASSQQARSPSFDSPVPAIVLDTPRPIKEVLDDLMTPTPQTCSDNVAKVTPNSPKRARADFPLVKSILMSEEGKKYNFDMLFGTAALDRSRRTVFKPTRYEDEMVARKDSIEK